MSGHSKWSTIKRKKGALDAKRGQLFTKLGKAISIAAREGGGDMDTNFTLRLAVEKAKKASLPADNIERAIKRGTGDSDDGIVIEKAVYGGYGPGGVAIAVDVVTDNKNRTVSELRKLFEDHGGNLAEASSVLWQFKEKGKVAVKCAKMEKSEKFGEEDKPIAVDKDEVMLVLMDVAGVEDVECMEAAVVAEENADDPESGKFDVCEVYTGAKDLAKVRGEVEKLEFILDSAELVKIPENMQEINDEDKEKLTTLLEAVDDHDDVENIWFNSEV